MFRECSTVYYYRYYITYIYIVCVYLYISSVQFSLSVMSNSLRHHESQHARPPCPSPTPGVYSNSCLLTWWCHPTISSPVIPFSSCLQSFPESGSFPVSQFLASGGQTIGASASASALPMNIQDWSPLGLNGLLFLQSKGLLKSLLQRYSSWSLYKKALLCSVAQSHLILWDPHGL